MSRKYRDAPKSDLDSQRELLDSLMGINRNNDRDEDRIVDFHDERVCKFYLLGLCPHDMFLNTKMDCGPCSRMHIDSLKEEFETTMTGEKSHIFDHIIEREFTSRVYDIDRVIEKARSRLEEEKNEEDSNPLLNPDVIKLTAEIQKITAEAEAAGEEGDIDKAQELMSKVEGLNKSKQDIINRINDQKKALQQKVGVDVNKKLRVCDVCGSYLSILDSDKRLQDHFMGKQHMGYQLIRDKLTEIKERKEKMKAEGTDSKASRVVKSEDRVRGSSRERSKRHSSRDRDRDGDRDRHRDRSRDGRRSRDRDRDRRRRSRSPRREDSRDRGRRR